MPDTTTRVDALLDWGTRLATMLENGNARTETVPDATRRLAAMIELHDPYLAERLRKAVEAPVVTEAETARAVATFLAAPDSVSTFEAMRSAIGAARA